MTLAPGVVRADDVDEALKEVQNSVNMCVGMKLLKPVEPESKGEVAYKVTNFKCPCMGMLEYFCLKFKGQYGEVATLKSRFFNYKNIQINIFNWTTDIL